MSGVISNNKFDFEEFEEPSIKPEPTFWEKYEKHAIKMSKPIEKPEPVITIDSNTISTNGNITTISGSPKAGKSGVSSVILAGAIRKEESEYNGFEGLEITPNYHEKAVIHIDTEQSSYDHYNNTKNAILQRVGLKKEPDYFHSYNIRSMSIKEMKTFTEDFFIESDLRHNGIHLAIVDGVADFILSVNDETEANEIIRFFESLAVKYSCPIILILHLNPNSNKERGHLGSQLQRKSESVLQIKKENDVSYIEPTEFFRHASSSQMHIIQFRYDIESGFHVYAGHRERESKNMFDVYKEISEVVFSDEPLSYKEAVDEIVKIKDVKERTAKNYISNMKKHDLIQETQPQNMDKRYKYYVAK